MRTSTRFRKLVCAAALGAIACAAAPASAQQQTQNDQLALGRFYPSAAGDRFFGVQSPYVNGELTPHAMLLFDYAHNPLVLRTTKDSTTIGPVVANQLFLHVNGSLALFDRVLVNVDVPVAIFQSGDAPSGGGFTFPKPSAADFGDLRLGARIRVFGEYDDLLQLAVGGYIWAPTGTGKFVTDGDWRGLPQFIIGGMHDRFTYSVSFGPEIRKQQNYFGSVGQGLSLQINGGIAARLLEDRALQIGPEFYVTTTMRDSNARNTNAEVLLGAKYRFAKVLEAGAGVGVGLTSGVGTPDVRAVAMFAYTPDHKKPDQDQDGIADKDDACVDVKGVPNADPKKNGCPPDSDNDGIIDDKDSCPQLAGVPNDDPKKNGCPPDTDNDGIYDAQDACPAVPGVSDPNPQKNGCPPDKDNDGIIDAQDACPEVPGVSDPNPQKNGCPPDRDNDGVPDKDDACPDIAGLKTSDPATNGCPGDTDRDGIRDDKDACPNEKGQPDPDPKQNGCPKAVRVTETEVIILQQVQFDTAKATIKKVSDPLLDEVAGVLNEHPELTKVEVQGHTDSRGAAALNRKLSQSRADAVKEALIKRKVDGNRLAAKGYGPDRPVGDNATEEGRQANRRVQFVIIEKKMKDGTTKTFENPPPPPPAPAQPKDPKAPKDKAPAPKDAPKDKAPQKIPAPAPKAPAPKEAPKAPAPKAPAPKAPAPKAPAPPKK